MREEKWAVSDGSEGKKSRVPEYTDGRTEGRISGGWWRRSEWISAECTQSSPP